MNIAMTSDGWVELWSSIPTEIEVTTFAYGKGWCSDLRVYDHTGSVHRVAQAIPRSRIGRFQAMVVGSVFSRKIIVDLEFGPPEPYDLGALKAELHHLLLLDDDVLTQHENREKLEALISEAQSYQELLAIIDTATVA